MVALLLAAILALHAAPGSGPVHFALLGDRTGEAQPGVYEQVLREAAAGHPAFLLQAGDVIQGLNDAAAEGEWQEFQRILAPYRHYALYLAPGNHDIWSRQSEELFRKHAGRAPHYSFDYGPAHFTILDNSRSDELTAGELLFLEKDLEAHAAQPVKFIVSHRPSWLFNVVLRNSGFPLHRLAKKYGVRYVIAGHVHQMLRADLDGVMYVSLPSAGGHLRASKRYEDGWFFAYTLVNVSGKGVDFQVHELNAPHGQGRVTAMEDWGVAGLVRKLSLGRGPQRLNP